MTGSIRIGIIGDYDSERASHTATETALEHAGEELGIAIERTWLPTPSFEAETNARDMVSRFDGMWCAPGSPYQSFEGALAAIRHAREADLPFIGTCGGFQHVVLEYARNVLGFTDAQHAEYAPDASNPFVAPLSCSLKDMRVRLKPGSNVHTFYGRDEVVEEYRCSFGVNREHQRLLDQGGLRVVGVDEGGEARIVTLPRQRFFVATLFVPQLSSTPERPHPLLTAFIHALCQA